MTWVVDPTAPPPAPPASPAGAPARPTAIVMGGGIAGIAAALRLADAGWAVTLIETRKHLGGRATSHVDPKTGLPLDNCQHVILRCCSTVLDLFDRLGVADRIEWHDTLHFLDDRGRRSDLTATALLPAPAHLAPSLVRATFLSARAKLAVVRGMSALRRSEGVSEAVSFADWLRRHRQPEEAIGRFWAVVTVSALNEQPERASCASAAKVFRDAFLAARDSYVMGVPRVPLARLYERTGELLRASGGDVQVGTAVTGVELSADGRVNRVTCGDGRALRAHAYVSALPPYRLGKLLPPAANSIDPRLSSLDQFEFSPILGLHLWFARPVLELPHAILVGSPLHWLFDRGTDDVGVQHLHAVVSAAREWVEWPAGRIVAAAVNEVRRYLPAARGVAIVRGEVIKERRATFSPLPGVERLRPAAAGPIENLFLAGDYCQTGWPATMEGAARSGYLAADAARRAIPRRALA